MRKSGYDTYFKRVQKTRSSKHKQKGIDTSIFINVLKLAEEDTYDKAILVTGDGDFADLIGLLEHDNRKIIIWRKKRIKIFSRESFAELRSSNKQEYLEINAQNYYEFGYLRGLY